MFAFSELTQKNFEKPVNHCDLFSDLLVPSYDFPMELYLSTFFMIRNCHPCV